MKPAELTRRTPLPRHEAERLLALAAGLPRHKAMTRTAVPGGVIATFRSLVERRRRGEPLQYIEGAVSFGPIEVLVDGRVLIPRPETEQLYAMLAAGPSPEVIVDCCTGSGCLGVALARSFPDADVHLTDISSDALDVARLNISHNGVAASAWQGDLLEALPGSLEGRIDLLVANPPYVRHSEIDHLEAQVREHEPHMALDGGLEGLDLLERIATQLPRWLAPGGRFAIEFGLGQSEAVMRLFAVFQGEIHKDGYGRDRFVTGARAG